MNTKKRGRGRPKLDRPRCKQVTIRMTADVAKAVDAIAEAHAWARSTAACALIRLGLEAVERGTDPLEAMRR